MAITYEPLATTTLSATSTEVSFTSISSSYTDLILASNVAMNSQADLFLRLNSDTAANYAYAFITGQASGSSVSSSRVINTGNVRMGYYALPQTEFEFCNITHIFDYANTVTHKNWITRASAASKGSDFLYATWRNTNAVTSLTIKANTGHFLIGSTWALYGIKAA